MMKNDEYFTEVLLVSDYCSIIEKILNKHRTLSVVKTLLFSYLLHSNDKYYKKLYNSNTKDKILLKAISQISGRYDDFCNNMSYIIEAIHLLIKCNKIQLIDSNLVINNEQNNIGYVDIDNKFIDDSIKNSLNISDRQILKEIINNV